MEVIAKHDLSPIKMEHALLCLAGIAMMVFHAKYETMSGIPQVLILVIYLGLLLGIAPVPMPVFRSKFWQVFFAGIISSVLDSFIVLKQMKSLRTLESTQDRQAVIVDQQDQETVGVRAQLLALGTLAAIIGGLMIWFGEVYAAGLFNSDGRTGPFSALFIIPPALLFLTVLGIHASWLPIEVVQNEAKVMNLRNIMEFAIGIILLLLTHNSLLCLGILLAYCVITHQADHLLDSWKEETEINIMLVLLIAWITGGWVLKNLIAPSGLGQGSFLPIIPAAIQAVLWGPLYSDPTVHFWMRVTTLSTGAMLLPISSLVGVMLFRTSFQWWLYTRYSIPYAILWYMIMRLWICGILESPIGAFLEQWSRPHGAG